MMAIWEPTEDGAVNPAGDRRKHHSVQKPKKPGLFSNFQDFIQGKSYETEQPKLRKASSASNSPAPKPTRPVGASITLPNPTPQSHRGGLRYYTTASTSNHGEPHRNNGSREADGYQIRAPPPRSYQDDDTRPSPKKLLMAVMAVENAVRLFAKVLISDMNKHPVELAYLKQTILCELNSQVERANHWMFFVQAFICQRLFEGFDTPNGYFGIEYFENDRQSTLTSFADFSKFKDKAATISTLMDSDSPDMSFLGRFCFKKFKSISGELASNEPLPLYKEEWYTVDRNRHPKSVFYQSFLKVAVSVWLLHRLVYAFEQKVDMLTYAKGAPFQRKNMESVVPGVYEEEDKEHDVHIEVGFSVIPGFQVSRSVVKCEVYLQNKKNQRHPEMETTTGRPSTEKSQSPYDVWNKLYESTSVQHVHTDYAAKVNLVSELLDVFIETEAQSQGLDSTSTNERASSSSTSWQLQQQQPATTTVEENVNTRAESETHEVNEMFAKIHVHDNTAQTSEEAERKAKKVAAKEAKQREKAKSKAEQDAKIESMMRLLQDVLTRRDKNNTMLQSDARMLEKKMDTIQEKIGKLHEKTEKIHDVSREIKTTQVHSKQRRVPRIMLCTERGVNMKQKLLTKLPVGIRAMQLHLLCEQPGQEHIVANATGCEINQKIGERWEELQPLVTTGLQLLTMAVNVGGAVAGVGQIFPNLGRNVWDIQAVDLGRHAVQSGRKVQGEQAVADALRAACEEESVAQWLVSYLEKNEVVILDAFGLLRVRYTRNCPPYYSQGSLAWLCSEHHSQGCGAGILESFPIRR